MLRPQTGHATDGQELSTERDTISVFMATSWSCKPGTLGSSVMGSFFDEYMPGVVAQEGCCGVFGCTESDGEPVIRDEVCLYHAYIPLVIRLYRATEHALPAADDEVIPECAIS